MPLTKQRKRPRWWWNWDLKGVLDGPDSTSGLLILALPWPLSLTGPLTLPLPMELTWWQWYSWGFLWPPPLLRDPRVAVAGGVWAPRTTNPHYLASRTFSSRADLPYCAFPWPCVCPHSTSPRSAIPLIWLSHLQIINNPFQTALPPRTIPAPQPSSAGAGFPQLWHFMVLYTLKCSLFSH